MKTIYFTGIVYIFAFFFIYNIYNRIAHAQYDATLRLKDPICELIIGICGLVFLGCQICISNWNYNNNNEYHIMPTKCKYF